MKNSTPSYSFYDELEQAELHLLTSEAESPYLDRIFEPDLTSARGLLEDVVGRRKSIVLNNKMR